MRKIIFTINDAEYFRKEYPQLTFTDADTFKATYLLIGEKQPDKYEITDYDGKEICIDDLNGYQRGIILCECVKYFEGKIKNPYGVVKIEETTI